MVRADDPRPRWRLLVRNGSALACACLAMVWLGTVTAGQYRTAARLDREAELLERWNADHILRNQELRRHAAELATDAGMEREARKLGYVRKGEVRLRVPSRRR